MNHTEERISRVADGRIENAAGGKEGPIFHQGCKDAARMKKMRRERTSFDYDWLTTLIRKSIRLNRLCYARRECSITTRTK